MSAATHPETVERHETARQYGRCTAFHRLGSVVDVFSRVGPAYYLLGSFRMPADCETLDDFRAAYWSYRKLGDYRLDA